MTKIILNRFDGGHAEDIRTLNNGESEESINFDIFSNPFYLQPYRDNAEEQVDSASASDYVLNSAMLASFSGTSYYICFGKNSSVSSTVKIFYKAVADATVTWASGNTGTGNIVNGTGLVYKNFPYVLTTNGSDTLLIKATDNATLSTAGTITGYTGTIKPFIHPEDNIMYIVAGTSISTWDGTTLTTVTTILPTGFSPASLTNWGGYLVIAGNLNGKAIAYLWGRDTSINTLQGIIDFGDGIIYIIENINETLIAVTTPASTLQITNKIEIKGWNGGSVEVLKSISGSMGNNHKFKKNNRLYFASTEEAIYTFGKNKSGYWVLSKDRLIYTGADATVINGLNFIGDWLWIGFTISGGNTYFYRTANSDTYLRTSSYKTTINPKMDIEDRFKKKQLKNVRVSYTGASTGNTILKYYTDGGSVTTIYSAANSTGEKVFETGKESDGKALKTGREFQFQIECTGGSKIKEIMYEYEVIETR